MKRNFRLVSSIELQVEGRTFDLHNDYDITSWLMSSEQGSAEIGFSPWSGAGGGARPSLRMNFSGLSALEAGSDPDTVVGSDLVEMGFKNPADRDIDWLLTEDEAEEEDHFFLRLSNDSYLRIAAAEVEVVITQGKPN